MAKIFLYEFVTGGGFLGDRRHPPSHSLLREGAAMVAALAEDLVATGARVEMLLDDRLAQFDPQQNKRNGLPRFNALQDAPVCLHMVRTAEEEQAAFAELAAACDATIVIAPELANALWNRCRRVEAAGGKLLGPSVATVALASDKHATAEYLRSFAIPVPPGWRVGPGGAVPAEVEFPAVGKPCLGAGSQGVCFLADRQAAEAWAAHLQEPSRIERFRPGTAASVAVLCGPAGLFPMVPCRQRLGGDDCFSYQGGSLPLDGPLAQRAVDLAVRAVATLPGACGYLGVDLVLGADPKGGGDFVIEINPRLTTSYVGLRAAAAEDANLAAAILDVCEGRVPRLSFQPVAVQFEPDGRFERHALHRWPTAQVAQTNARA